MLAEIEAALRRSENVLLVGPAEVGKTALIQALSPRDVVVLDPFEHVSPHLAGRVRRAIERGTVHLAAARSLDRRHLGAVRRIAFWFTTIRVPLLSARWLQRLVERECAAVRLDAAVITPQWTSTIVRLARGRPGVALMMVRAAARLQAARGTLPSPAVAYIEARVRRAEALGVGRAGGP